MQWHIGGEVARSGRGGRVFEAVCGGKGDQECSVSRWQVAEVHRAFPPTPQKRNEIINYIRT